MKSNKFILYFLILLNVCSCILLYRNKQKIESLYKESLEYQFQANYLLDTQDKLVILAKIQMQAEGQTVNNVRLYNADDSNSILLGDLLQEEPKLVYYFSERGCSACFEPVLIKLDSLGKEIKPENIIIISNFPNNRSLKAYMEQKFKNVKVYRTDDKLGLIDDPMYEYAYAFLLSPNRCAHKIIVTDKSNTAISDAYLSYMDYYFSHLKQDPTLKQ